MSFVNNNSTKIHIAAEVSVALILTVYTIRSNRYFEKQNVELKERLRVCESMLERHEKALNFIMNQPTPPVVTPAVKKEFERPLPPPPSPPPVVVKAKFQPTLPTVVEEVDEDQENDMMDTEIQSELEKLNLT